MRPTHPRPSAGRAPVVMSNYLRSCAGCSAHLLSGDPSSEYVWCSKCRAKHVTPFGQWAAALKPGDLVYVQPYAAWRGLSHSQYLIVARDGDVLTVQVLGLPESRGPVHVAHVGQHNLTPRTRP